MEEPYSSMESDHHMISSYCIVKGLHRDSESHAYRDTFDCVENHTSRSHPCWVGVHHNSRCMHAFPTPTTEHSHMLGCLLPWSAQALRDTCLLTSCIKLHRIKNKRPNIVYSRLLVTGLPNHTAPAFTCCWSRSTQGILDKSMPFTN